MQQPSALSPEHDFAIKWTDKLLVALQANAEGQNCTTETYEDGEELKLVLKSLGKDLKKATEIQLIRLIDKMTTCMFQMRSWYTANLGLLVVDVFKTVLRVKSLPAVGQDALMLILKLLEGLLLICTVSHEPELVSSTLAQLIQARRLPPCVNARLESCVVYWSCRDDWQGVPPKVPICTRSGGLSEVVEARAQALAPSERTLADMKVAKQLIEQIVIDKWPDAGVFFFGSAINGFELEGSDLDCVIQLPSRLLEAGDGTTDDAAAAADGPPGRPDRKREAIAAVEALEQVCKESKNSHLVRIVEKVTTARVPLLKLKTVESKVAVDVSFNNTLPLYNSRLLRAYSQLDPRVPHLGRFLKHWAKKRAVGDAKEGTLSSYSHILLLIHFLQHEGVLPNLQDKSMIDESKWASVGTVEKVEGMHDVWFMDPEKEGCKEELQAWLKNRNEDAKKATLEGLLRNFFRYYAYSLAIHRYVVTITAAPGERVNKIRHFRQVAAAMSALNPEDGEHDKELAPSDAVDDDVGDQEGCETEDGFPESADVEEEVGDYYMRDESESEEDIASKPSGLPVIEEQEKHPVIEEQAANEVVTQTLEGSPVTGSPVTGPTPAPVQELAPSGKLHPIEQQAQHQLSQRQLLCIADPMELGRSLGTTFQGGDRLIFELRRACHILEHPHLSPETKLRQLLQDQPPPPKSPWRLYESREFPSIFEAEQTTKVPINARGRDLLLGNGGAFIKELQSSEGMRRVKVDGGRNETKGQCVFSGTPEAVKRCVEHFTQRQNAYNLRMGGGGGGAGGGGVGAGGGGGAGVGGGGAQAGRHWVGSSAAASSWAPQSASWSRGSWGDYSTGYGSNYPRRGSDMVYSRQAQPAPTRTLGDYFHPAAQASQSGQRVTTSKISRSIAEQTAVLQKQGRAELEAQASRIGPIGSQLTRPPDPPAAAASAAAAAAAATSAWTSEASQMSTPSTVASTPTVWNKGSNKISKSNKIPKPATEAASAPPASIPVPPPPPPAPPAPGSGTGSKTKTEPPAATPLLAWQ